MYIFVYSVQVLIIFASVNEIIRIHFVCLHVSRIVQKLLNEFSQNLVERWQMGHGRTGRMMIIRNPAHVTLGLRLRQG